MCDGSTDGRSKRRLYALPSGSIKIESRIGNCYSGDHFARNHTQTNITTCNIEIHNTSTALERSIKDYWGTKTRFTESKPLPSISALVRNI